MTQVSCYQPKKGTPGALAMVIALHAAGIAGLMMWKIDVTRVVPTVTETWNIPIPEDPKPIPPESKPEVEIPVVKALPTVPPVVKLPPLADAPAFELADVNPPPIPSLPGHSTIEAPVKPPAPWIEHAAKAKGDVRQLFTADDYPTAAVRRDETGNVRARLAIGADGRVAGCRIVESSGSATLDQATCRILKSRARFTPAKDSNGRLTSDDYLTPTISWRLVDQG